MPQTALVRRKEVIVNLISTMCMFVMLIQAFRENNEHNGSTASAINLVAYIQMFWAMFMLCKWGLATGDDDSLAVVDTLSLLGSGGVSGAVANNMERFSLHAGLPRPVEITAIGLPIGVVLSLIAHGLMKRGYRGPVVSTLLFFGSLLPTGFFATAAASSARALHNGDGDRLAHTLNLVGATGNSAAFGITTFCNAVDLIDAIVFYLNTIRHSRYVPLITAQSSNDGAGGSSLSPRR